MGKVWYIIYITALVLFFLTLIFGSRAQKKIAKIINLYNKAVSFCGATAQEFSLILLSKANITNVEIVEVNGKNTDCYDSINKILKLSNETMNSTSLASLGVCAHEIGHAIQDKEKNFLFKARVWILPFFNLIAKLFFPLLMVGSLLSFSFNMETLGLIVLWFSIISYGSAFVFYLVTTPLESNASKKVVALLHDCDFLTKEEIVALSQVLNVEISMYLSVLTDSFFYFIKFLSYSQAFEE